MEITVRKLLELTDTLDAKLDVIIFYREPLNNEVLKKGVAPVEYIRFERNGRIGIQINHGDLKELIER